MPSNTPLTETPYALLPDAPNIESAVPPGFLHLERYAIPRFSSVSERNAAFADNDSEPPSVGQMVYVFSRGHLGYQVWNGNSWEEFGQYTRTRKLYAVKQEDQATNSTNPVNIADFTLSIPTAGTWEFEAQMYYRQDFGSDSDGINFNIFYPDASEQLRLALTGRGANSGGGRTDSTTVNVTAPTGLSGQFTLVEFGIPSAGGSDGANMKGLLFLTSGGDVTMRFGRRGPSGGVLVRSGSYMSAQRLP